jgi:hypothetical protein
MVGQLDLVCETKRQEHPVAVGEDAQKAVNLCKQA